MIVRYEDPRIKAIWSDQNKFSEWLKTELAIIKGRVRLNQLSPEIFSRIQSQARFSLERIKEIEAKTKHDLLSFVQAVQESLDPDLRQYIHSGGVTSYDTEEPALCQLMLSSLDHIMALTSSFCDLVWSQALKYKYLIMIGRTHGQHAEPITLGLKFLNYYDALERAHCRIVQANEAMYESKISGAVGTYGHGLSPELEQEALRILDLKPARITTQIMFRDRIADVLWSIAMYGTVLEKIAIDIRLAGQSERHEIQEPFGEQQKGSSIMPHKKNTIDTEKICGLARMLKHYAMIAMENTPTWDERDISHSSAERIILPDAFHTIAHIITTMYKVIEGMEVHEDDIARNLKITQGTATSPRVKDLLIEYGIDSETAYRICQELSFQAIKTGTCFLDLIEQDSRVPSSINENNMLDQFYEECYEEVRYVNEIFDRFIQVKKGDKYVGWFRY